MKKTCSLLFIVLSSCIILITQTQCTPEGIPSATSDFYVNDFARVFSEAEKMTLMERAVNLANTTNGTQIVITTVKSLGGRNVEDYAHTMYNQYGIGKNDMGLLILLSTGDREIRVEVGNNMEAYVNDAKAGRFIDNYAIPKLKENKFNEGLISLQRELIIEIKNSIGNETNEYAGYTKPIMLEGKVDKPEGVSVETNWGAIGLIAMVLVFLSIPICGLIIVYKKNKKIEKLKQEVKKLVNDHNEAMKKAVLECQQLREDYNEQLSRTRQRATSDVKEEQTRSLERSAELNQKIEEVKRKCTDLRGERTALYEEKESLAGKLAVLQDRYNRVNTLYPEADKEVTRMIENEIREQDMAKAAKVDSIVEETLLLVASKDIIQKIKQAQIAYDELSNAQKKYAKADISRLKELYEQSMRLKHQFSATEAVATITAIIAGIIVGKEVHLKKLALAKSTYDNLGHEAQAYVDKSIPDKISLLISQAEQEKKEREKLEEAERKRKEEEERKRKQEEERRKKEAEEKKRKEEEERRRREEEERRRRRQREEEEQRRRSASSSHFGGGSSFSSGRSSSGFSGFGGRSSGGGASRKF